jgi:hypothetical protein
MSQKRSFSILDVETNSGKKKDHGEGRYISSTPRGAASKAATKLCREHKGECSLIVTIRETTQGSQHKHYQYKIKRVHDPRTVVRNGIEIEYQYRIDIHSHSEKKSRSPRKSPKKSRSPRKSPKKSRSPRKSPKKSRSPRKSPKKSRSPKKSK